MFASGASGQWSRLVPAFEEGDSTAGLAGYHGSVATVNDDRVYYTVSVYSERSANGATNGIPVFREPWKNVAATLYHQLMETRTNPDVEEAIRRSAEGTGEPYLGWISASGLELGDIPIRSDIPLSRIFREVPLANGSGVVAVVQRGAWSRRAARTAASAAGPLNRANEERGTTAATGTFS